MMDWTGYGMPCPNLVQQTVADSRLCRRLMCGIRLNTTGSRTRGYSPFRASRPSDAPAYIQLWKRENV